MADNALLPLAQREAGYLRPATAPNGTVWPSGSGYIEGYAHLNETGLSEVTIDNSLNPVWDQIDLPLSRLLFRLEPHHWRAMQWPMFWQEAEAAA